MGVDALLDLYRHCPDSRRRAVELHDRANSVGRVFESLVNGALSGSTWPNGKESEAVAHLLSGGRVDDLQIGLQAG